MHIFSLFRFTKQRMFYAYSLFGLPRKRFAHFKIKRNLLCFATVTSFGKDILQNVWFCAAYSV